jgi:DNA polymerase III alpha subunit (gram-positive type)
LTQTDDEEIELLDWTSVALQDLETVEGEAHKLRIEVEQQARMISKLNDQLKDISEAKLEHETTMLQKFNDILNSKKLKIRDQQRLISGAKLDPDKGTCFRCDPELHLRRDSVCLQLCLFSFLALQVQESRRSRTTEALRASNRKAGVRKQASAEDETGSSNSESDAFEDLAVRDSEDERRNTPLPSDRDTDNELPPPPPKRTVRHAIGGKAKKPAAEPTRMEIDSSSESATSTHAAKQATISMPERTQPAGNGAASKPALEDDSETDDEL